jgi:hypothetical protein
MLETRANGGEAAAFMFVCQRRMHTEPNSVSGITRATMPRLHHHMREYCIGLRLNLWHGINAQRRVSKLYWFREASRPEANPRQNRKWCNCAGLQKIGNAPMSLMRRRWVTYQFPLVSLHGGCYVAASPIRKKTHQQRKSLKIW